MSTINGYDSNSISTLFSNLGTTTNTNSSATDGLYGINVIDYNTIRNGSYGKLMKAYYSMDEEQVDKNSKNDTDDTDATLRSIKDATDDLKDSAQALYGSKSLFTADANGEYDMEAIYEKVNAFIEDYNATVESVGSAETERIANAGAILVNATNEYVDMLDKLGISINSSDFTLSINKEEFLKSNIADVKSMFSGVGSFAYQVGAKASRVNNFVSEKVSASGYYVSATKNSETSSSTSKDTANTIAKLLDNAKSLNAYAIDLYKNKTLFDTDSEDYDEEAIVDAISEFVEKYNDLIISSENSSSTGITNAMESLTGITDNYAARLETIGISIDKDNTLQFNEAAFREANTYSVETIFSGTASYAYKIAVKAAMAANQAETEAAKANTYTEDGTYSNNYNTGSILDGLV